MHSKKVFGVDVLHWNGAINWYAAKHDSAYPISFAFIKATEGAGFKDGKFDVNWNGAIANDIKAFPYHFFRTSEAPSLQAENLFTVLENKSIVNYAIDIEQASIITPVSKQSFAAMLEEFILSFNTLSAQNYTPYLYTGTNFWNDNIGAYGTHLTDITKLWIPRWFNNNGSIPAPDPGPLPMGFSQYEVWQFTSKGSISGFSGDVDINLDNNGGFLEHTLSLTEL